jgi:hypothetical protein
VRSVCSGLAGTAALTLAYALERRLRPGVRGPLDYDDGLVPGRIVARAMRLRDVSDREVHELGLVLRWSYGSAFAIVHGALRHGIREPWSALAFGGTVMASTLTLLPLLGNTPAPWRWPADVMATSLGTHAAYAGTVATVDGALRRAAARRGRSLSG